MPAPAVAVPTPADRLGRVIVPTRPPHGPVSLALRLAAAVAVIVPASAVYILVCLFLLPWRAARIVAGNAYGKIVGRTMQRCSGIVPEIHDEGRVAGSRPALFVMNHASTIDMWIGMWLCPFRGCGVGKKEIVRIPVFGLAYLVSGHLLLDRENREKAIASMAKAQAVVARHRLSMFLWPEGTRSRDGRLRPFKKGFAHLALATRLPIVPIVAHEADRFWPGGTFTVRPGRLQMEVLPPIPTTGWSEETLDADIEVVRDAFRAALGERQQPAAEEPAG